VENNFIKIIRDNSYVKNAKYIFCLNTVNTGIGIISTLLMTNLLPLEEYGFYKYLLAVIYGLSFFSLSGIPIVIVPGVARGNGRIFLEATRLRIKWSFLGTLVLIIFSTYSFSEGFHRESLGLAIGAVLYPLIFSLDTYTSFFDGKKEFKKSANFNLLSSTLKICFTILALLIFRDAIYMLFAGLLSIVLYNLWIHGRIKRTYDLKNKSSDPELINFGKKLSIAKSLPAIRGHLDKIVIGKFVSLSEVGFFSIGELIAGQVSLLYTSFIRILSPSLAGFSTDQERKDKVRGFLLKAFIGSLLFTFIIILIIPNLIRLFLPDVFEKSILYTQLMLISVWMGLPGAILENYYFTLSGRKDLVNTVIIAYSIFELGILPLFLVLWGVIGVILAKMVTRGLASLVLFSLVFL